MKLKINVDGKTYEVDVEAEQPEAPKPGYVPPASLPSGPTASATTAPAAPAPAGPAVANESKACRSPIAGVVVRVNVTVGQETQPNEVLLVLEAMKMETVISSPAAGKIKQLFVAAGDPVKGGQVLVEFA